jgi:hypothetical protein
MKFEIFRLNLVAPLVFAPQAEADPYNIPSDKLFRQIEGGGEYLFCFEIDSSESLKFEPDPAGLLGPLANTGNPILPAGQYMFSQMRSILGKDEILEMAVEIQKEALWQRLVPEPRLYLRYLCEDGRGVTQVFRPYTDGPEN